MNVMILRTIFRTKEEWEKIKNEPDDYFGLKESDSEHSSTDEPESKSDVIAPTSKSMKSFPNSSSTTSSTSKSSTTTKPSSKPRKKPGSTTTTLAQKRDRQDSSSDSSMSDEPMKAPESPGKWEIVPGSSQTRSV